MIQTYDGLAALPKSLRIYGASDYATMAPKAGKKEPDFTEHGIWGMDAKGELWAIDWWSRQCETDISIAQFIRMVRLWKPLKWFDEGGLIEKAIGPTIRKAMRDNQAYVAIESLPSLTDKGVRLQAFHAMATAGVIHFPVKRKWATDCIEQLVKFPAGRWDDKADVCGLIGRGVDLMFDAQLPARDTRPILVPFTEAWLMYNDRNQAPKVRYY
jgi:predicted phage terminase large subunit-like protein